jgi:hypothetical protein
MKCLDPHIHAGASECSRLTDEQLVAFFLEHPDFVPIVSDHMSMLWYDKYVGPGKTFRDDECLFAIEISTWEPWTDLLLISYDRSALEPFKPFISKQGRWFKPCPPLKLLDDPRIIVVWAHPEEAVPTWLHNVPVDFLEFNSAHMSLSHVGEETAGKVVQNYHDKFFPATRFIVGSDSHQEWTLGRTFIEFDHEVNTGREAWQAVKDGKFTCHYPAQNGFKQWVFRPTSECPISLRGERQFSSPKGWSSAGWDDVESQLYGWDDDDDYPDNSTKPATLKRFKSFAELLAEADAAEGKSANPVLAMEKRCNSPKSKGKVKACLITRR